MNSPSVFLPACANWVPGTSVCEKQGGQACKNCRLVVYCSTDCQRTHWPEHKKACRSPMGKQNWRPAWDLEGRQPPWATGAASTNVHNLFGGSKYFWGNTPAVDVLNLEQNEGLAYGDDIALLFAASGDLRHVVKTIASLPNQMTQQISVTMNDREFGVVARNTILLLLALTAQDSTDSEDNSTPIDMAAVLIHVWYSASFSSGIYLCLQNRVKSLISDVCSRAANKLPTDVLSETWGFSGGRSLRLVLKKSEWLQLQGLLDIPGDITPEYAAQIRTAVTLAPERADYRDRWYFKDASPAIRLAKQRFREDGLLLPFGHPRMAFDIPNPTFFSDTKRWPMDDKSDPSDGWPILDIQHTSSPAPNDWYGKLFVYLHNLLERFLDRLKKIQISFELYNVEVNELSQFLESDRYSRIEVANICDGGYLGIRKTLSLLAPSLQSSRYNPHATFITLFINAVKEAEKMGFKREEKYDIDFLTNYLPFPQLSPNIMNDADMVRIHDASGLAVNVNKAFERYMEYVDFEQIATDLGVEMKGLNTIIEKWPTQLKLQPEEKGAEEEFRLNLGSSLTKFERYVEWRRVD